MEKLIPSPRVDFDETTHSYLLDGCKYLMGVTSLMRKHGLSANYKGVSEDTLEKAAERGSKGHAVIEEYCKFKKHGNTKIIKSFKALKLDVMDNEFLVSDFEMVASKIDILLSDYSIVDIKFTSQLHVEALQWQLSIYAYLLESYYGVKVPKVYALHYDKQYNCKLIEIQRLPDSYVIDLLEAERECQTYEPLPIVTKADKAVSQLYEVTKYIDNLKKRIKEAETQQKEMQQAFLSQMEATNTKSIITEFCRITYIAESTREMVDAKALKESEPEIYEKYKKITTIKPSVRILINNKNE